MNRGAAVLAQGAPRTGAIRFERMADESDSRVSGIVGGLGLAAIMLPTSAWLGRGLFASSQTAPAAGRGTGVLLIGWLIVTGLGVVGLWIAGACVAQRRDR